MSGVQGPRTEGPRRPKLASGASPSPAVSSHPSIWVLDRLSRAACAALSRVRNLLMSQAQPVKVVRDESIKRNKSHAMSDHANRDQNMQHDATASFHCVVCCGIECSARCGEVLGVLCGMVFGVLCLAASCAKLCAKWFSLVESPRMVRNVCGYR